MRQSASEITGFGQTHRSLNGATRRDILGPVTDDHDFAVLVLRRAALEPENEAECARVIREIAVQLGVEGETERATVTDLRAEGTGQVIRFPVSQAALKSVQGGPAWSSRVTELIYL